MPFHLIKGTFHVTGYAPDGDSVRFQAADRSLWGRLSGPPVDVNARGHAQLRIEAIDTLETHYEGHHQPLRFASGATHFLLEELGITAVEFGPTGRVSSANDGSPGYILTRKAEKYRRPVAFVFAGAAPEPDGSEVFLEPDRLEGSVNYRSALAGFAYPTFYTGLFADLRNKIAAAVKQARKGAGKGVWTKDRTTKGFPVTGLESVTEDAVIMPKLFRRIVGYLGDGGCIEGFKDYLAADPDPVLELKSGHFTNLDSFVTVKRHKVKLTVEPERLVFVEK